ncbi:MAG: hypothetical protein ACMG6E_03920, partial [Candidatus Roizmanbacteria bacterium]
MNVTIHDWTENGARSIVVPGTVLCKIDQPFGYDIQLDTPLAFHGNMPFPLSVTENMSYRQLDDTVECEVVFAKEYCLSFAENVLLQVLRSHFRDLVLRRCNVIKAVPEGHISYIAHFKENGTIETLSDDRALL